MGGDCEGALVNTSGWVVTVRELLLRYSKLLANQKGIRSWRSRVELPWLPFPQFTPFVEFFSCQLADRNVAHTIDETG